MGTSLTSTASWASPAASSLSKKQSATVKFGSSVNGNRRDVQTVKRVEMIGNTQQNHSLAQARATTIKTTLNKIA